MLAWLPIAFFLVALFVAPQLWVPAVKGWRVDLFVYPFWIGWLACRGRLVDAARFRSQDWFFVGMVVWFALSSIANGLTPASIPILSNYVKWFVLYRLTCASVDSRESLRDTGSVLLVVVSLIAIEAVLHLTSRNGVGWAGQSYSWVDISARAVGIEHRTRWVGIFDGPGVFCVMFTTALPFALRFQAPAHSFLMRLLAFGVMLPLLGVAIFSTGSRGGFLATAAIIGFWALSRFQLRFKTIVLGCIVAAAGVMLGPAYLTSTRDANSSAQHRVAMWVEGVEMVQQNPVFGIGKGNFARYTGRLIAHNSGIEIMGETGLVGLFLWFGVTYLGMKNLVRRYAESEDHRERELLIGLGLCVIGYFVSSLFVTLEYETLYFVLGLTASVRNWATTPVTFARKDMQILGTITVAYFAIIKIVVMIY